MADLTITPANVLPDTDAVCESGTAGEAVTAGQSIYQASADGKWYKALADTAAHAALRGVALNNAAANQPLAIQRNGHITIGATVVPGTVYCVSATAGGICPIADLVTTKYVSILGVGTTTAKILLNVLNTGVQVP